MPPISLRQQVIDASYPSGPHSPKSSYNHANSATVQKRPGPDEDKDYTDSTQPPTKKKKTKPQPLKIQKPSDHDPKSIDKPSANVRAGRLAILEMPGVSEQPPAPPAPLTYLQYHTDAREEDFWVYALRVHLGWEWTAIQAFILDHWSEARLGVRRSLLNRSRGPMRFFKEQPDDMWQDEYFWQNLEGTAEGWVVGYLAEKGKKGMKIDYSIPEDPKFLEQKKVKPVEAGAPDDDRSARKNSKSGSKPKQPRKPILKKPPPVDHLKEMEVGLGELKKYGYTKESLLPHFYGPKSNQGENAEGDHEDNDEDTTRTELENTEETNRPDVNNPYHGPKFREFAIEQGHFQPRRVMRPPPINTTVKLKAFAPMYSPTSSTSEDSPGSSHPAISASPWGDIDPGHWGSPVKKALDAQMDDLLTPAESVHSGEEDSSPQLLEDKTQVKVPIIDNLSRWRNDTPTSMSPIVEGTKPLFEIRKYEWNPKVTAESAYDIKDLPEEYVRLDERLFDQLPVANDLAIRYFVHSAVQYGLKDGMAGETVTKGIYKALDTEDFNFEVNEFEAQANNGDNSEAIVIGVYRVL